MNIGIYGGSFNPPHIAHLILAELLFEQLKLDTVLFIPSSMSPHKIGEITLDPEHRLRLTRLAVQDNERFDVSDIEIRRGGTSFTIDTIKELEKVYKNATLYLFIGSDNLVTFHQWRDYRAIMERCTLAAMNRPGFETGDVAVDIMKCTKILDVPYLEISSTDIRQRIREGRSVKYLVPDAVLREIEKCGYYKNE